MNAGDRAGTAPGAAAVPQLLSVAGSDPSGGAGIQADLKTATALGVYAGAVITAVTVQNTCGVRAVLAMEPDVVAEQCRAVLDDLDITAVKIGMLATEGIAEVVADVLQARPRLRVVLDPVMVATSGDRLVPPEVTSVIRRRLLPLADVITPNLPETGTLLDRPAPVDLSGMRAAAADLRAAGARAVLVKGGHLPGVADATGQIHDVLADGTGVVAFSGPRVATGNTHGTGCTLSTAIAAGLAQGRDLRAAVAAAREYLTGALRSGAGLRIGGGHGPVDHLWRLR